MSALLFTALTDFQAESRIPFANPSPIYLPIAINALDGDAIPSALSAAVFAAVAIARAFASAKYVFSDIPFANPVTT